MVRLDHRKYIPEMTGDQIKNNILDKLSVILYIIVITVMIFKMKNLRPHYVDSSYQLDNLLNTNDFLPIRRIDVNISYMI